jgi:hypothetical protein
MLDHKIPEPVKPGAPAPSVTAKGRRESGDVRGNVNGHVIGGPANLISADLPDRPGRSEQICPTSVVALSRTPGSLARTCIPAGKKEPAPHFGRSA